MLDEIFRNEYGVRFTIEEIFDVFQDLLTQHEEFYLIYTPSKKTLILTDNVMTYTFYEI